MQGGDKIPRKGGPGISQSDLLLVNKVFLIILLQCGDEVTIYHRLILHLMSVLLWKLWRGTLR